MMMSVFTRHARLIGLIVLAHWNKSSRIDMSPVSDRLSWFQTNQSLVLFLVNTARFIAEKQQIPIALSLAWLNRSSDPRFTTLYGSTLTITPPMRFLIMQFNSTICHNILFSIKHLDCHWIVTSACALLVPYVIIRIAFSVSAWLIRYMFGTSCP